MGNFYPFCYANLKPGSTFSADVISVCKGPKRPRDTIVSIIATLVLLLLCILHRGDGFFGSRGSRCQGFERIGGEGEGVCVIGWVEE